MIWVLVVVDIFLFALIAALWTCVQKISWSHYNLTQIVTEKLHAPKH